MSVAEQACLLQVDGDELVAIVHLPVDHAATGVIIVVGGPQYRVGSHRQFVLLARAISAAGYAVMRFDYRGMGDSAGNARGFDSIDNDVRGAVDDFVMRCGLERVVLWGLCDAASSALIGGSTIPRVVALILANPWVHSPQTEARVRLRSYYLGRLKSRNFWRKLARLDLDLRDTLVSLAGYLRRAVSRSRREIDSRSFIDRMRDGLADFAGPVFLILSGDDLVAGEFRELTASDRDWGELVEKSVTDTCELLESNHTFSRAEWRARVEQQTLQWLRRVDDQT